jgi:hypothetical protein
MCATVTCKLSPGRGGILEDSPALQERRQRSVTLSTFLAIATLAIVFLPSSARIALAQQTEEYHVKAAFLYHFVQMVDWPAQVPGEENKPITVCTIGKDPFDGYLDTTLHGKSIGARAVQVHHLRQPEEVQGCQVVFIDGSARKQVFLVLVSLNQPAILTVGETNDFAKQGGMIGFCMDDNNKVRFDINLDAASRAKLKISSRLLLLAKTVIGNHP